MKRILALLLFALLTAAAVLYILGVYDLSFVTRPEGDGAVGADTPEENAPTDTVTEEVLGATPTNKQTYDPLIGNDLFAAGYAITDAPYAGGTTELAQLRLTFTVPDVFSYRTKTEYTITMEQPEGETEYVPVYTPYETDRPALELYGGYVLFDYLGSTYLMNSLGEVLMTFDESLYTPAYTRDRDGNVLFLDGAGAYYRLAQNGTAFEMVDYNDSADGRGLSFDYPAYYGVSDSEKKLYYKVISSKTTTDENGNTVREDELAWTYSASGVGTKTKYPYSDAYAFSEGLALARDEDNHYYSILTESGTSYSGAVTKDYPLTGRDVIEWITAPATTGIESLGSFYFDHDLVRVRIRAIDAIYYRYSSKRIVTTYEKDTLMDKDGNLFAIPGGYRLVSYSDGMLLLEKDGRYGYMNYEGNWVLEPRYTYARPFIEGLAVVGYRDGRVGVVDTAGNFVVPLFYEYISDMSSGVMVTYRAGEGWRVLAKMVKGTGQ